MKKSLFFIICSAALVFTACQKPDTKEPVNPDAPSITLGIQGNLQVPLEGGLAEIPYEIVNPVDGGKISAVSSEDWAGEFNYDTDGVVAFTVQENEETEARSTIVTLTYTYGGGETVTAQVNVVQDGAVPYDYVYEDLPIFTGTYFSSNGPSGEVNYYTVISDKDLLMGTDLDAGGTYYVLDLYSTTEGEGESLLPPAGTYTLAAYEDCGDMTFSVDYSLGASLDDDGNTIFESVFSAGTVTVSYEGSTIEFNENTLAYDLSGVEYDEALLSYTVKGKGATASTSYNEETAVLSIRVEGNDFASNPESVTTYTIQFAVPAPAVDVTPIVGEYDSNLDITVGGTDAPATRSYINLAAGEAVGTVDLTIKDFVFSEIEVGDVNLTGVAVALLEDGSYELSLDEPQTLMLDVFGTGTPLPLTVTLNAAKVENGDLYASLTIDVMGSLTVTVEVSPYVEETPGVDVSQIVGDYKSKVVVEQGGMPGDPVEGNVTLAVGTEASTVDFTVEDLNCLGMAFGDVTVTGVAVTLDEEGVYTLAATDPQEFVDAAYGLDGTVALESATVTVSADKKELNATLTLVWQGQEMTVTITPAGEVGISDVAEGSDRIYAADGQIIAVVGEAKAITVVDLAGRTVYAAEATEGVNVISGLAEGIYIVNGEKVLVK